MTLGWRTLLELEECGDALLDEGSKQLPFYFANWRFKGEMWARVLLWEGKGQWGGHLSPLWVHGMSSLPLLILFSCRCSHRSRKRQNGDGRRQQRVLVWSLASLTLFTQSSQQLSQALPSITLCFEMLPPCMVPFCYSYLFYCSLFGQMLFSECWHLLYFPFLLDILLASNKSFWVIIESAICFNIFKI